MSPAGRLAADVDQLRTLVERLPHGVVTIDRTLTVLAANLAARRLFFPERLRLDQPLPPLWLDSGLESFVRGLFDRNLGAQRYEIRPDEKHAFVVTGVPPRKGETAILMIEDVSVEERRADAEREFIANAAHELLTPLTGIVGAAHALESGAKLEPQLRDRFLSHITRECNRMARIARGLLVLARAQSGQEPPRPDIVEVATLLELATDGAGAAGDVTIRCAADLTAFVDRDLVEQAFTNLIANARRQSSGAPVTITAFRNSDNDVEVEIADEGAGFDMTDGGPRPRFASGAGRDGGGFGLGLSIASQAVKLSGGNLTVGRRHEQGTIARVELPGAADSA
jgi:signal transduction histidine kinase